MCPFDFQCTPRVKDTKDRKVYGRCHAIAVDGGMMDVTSSRTIRTAALEVRTVAEGDRECEVRVLSTSAPGDLITHKTAI